MLKLDGIEITLNPNTAMDLRIKQRQYKKQLGLGLFAKRHGLKTTRHFPVDQYKQNDTVFILGSGSSINQLTAAQWEIIGKQDTIGFNNWTLHSFVPTYYFFEPTSEKNDFQKQMNREIYANISARSAAYKDTAVIIHYLKRYFFDFSILDSFKERDNLYFQAPVNLPGQDIRELQKAYTRAFHLKLFDRVDPAVYRRGSLAKIIHFAIACRYREIVLLGIDLNTSPYFFDMPDVTLPEGCRRVAFTQTGQSHQLHDTVNPDKGQVTMIDVLTTMNDIVLKPLDIRLSNGSAISALKDHLPDYWRLPTEEYRPQHGKPAEISFT